jgi:hypothetical protein
MKAFPMVVPDQSASEWYEEGRDLRDYFAAQVLQCIVIDDTNMHSSADFCYKVANAMMEARKND